MLYVPIQLFGSWLIWMYTYTFCKYMHISIPTSYILRIIFKNLILEFFFSAVIPSRYFFSSYFAPEYRIGVWVKRGDFSYNLISPRGWWACRWRPKRARVVGGVTAITPFSRWKGSVSGVSMGGVWRGSRGCERGGVDCVRNGGVGLNRGRRERGVDIAVGSPVPPPLPPPASSSSRFSHYRREPPRHRQANSSHTSDALATSCDVFPLCYYKTLACLWWQENVNRTLCPSYLRRPRRPPLEFTTTIITLLLRPHRRQSLPLCIPSARGNRL